MIRPCRPVRRSARCFSRSLAERALVIDFVHDQLATFSRFSPALDARFSYRGEDVVATLEWVWAEVGLPKVDRVDQGSEFVSRDLDLWAYRRHGVECPTSAPLGHLK